MVVVYLTILLGRLHHNPRSITHRIISAGTESPFSPLESFTPFDPEVIYCMRRCIRKPGSLDVLASLKLLSGLAKSVKEPGGILMSDVKMIGSSKPCSAIAVLVYCSASSRKRGGGGVRRYKGIVTLLQRIFCTGSTTRTPAAAEFGR